MTYLADVQINPCHTFDQIYVILKGQGINFHRHFYKKIQPIQMVNSLYEAIFFLILVYGNISVEKNYTKFQFLKDCQFRYPTIYKCPTTHILEFSGFIFDHELSAKSKQ